ncbi:MAG: hypothetical protein A3F11_04825 [Gammaproteobacteria bacterium RIFCSPHIGHO2_12_FULL_37_14]|nr:MAG: hypothetical protein A3F11_04825 [Gammaproteobacteria bacterium RIFCSPHIGHO2_12_FULL_37_14]
MDKKISWLTWLVLSFKEFIVDTSSKSQYEILDLYECGKTGFIKIIIQLSGRHIIEKNLSDVIIDNNFLEGFDKKSIRTLTYIATVEKLRPDYSVVVQSLGSEVDDYILEIRSRHNEQIVKKSPSEISKDKSLLSKFSSADANQIGYLAGMKETVKEFKMRFDKIRR